MPIVIPKEIPAYKTLNAENIFVLTERRASTQDIRPIEVGILNLMPIKWETETHLMRLLSNTPLHVNITLISTSTYSGKNTAPSHMKKFYKNFDDIKNQKFDGLIITGAPVETIDFSEVLYWSEMEKIMKWSTTNVFSTLFICWGAQAGLKYFYNIDKNMLAKKMFGVFAHEKCVEFDPLMKGLNDYFYIPNSRHTEVDQTAVWSCPQLQVLATSDEAGIGIVKSRNNRRFFFMGHSEYDRETLNNEYQRDIQKGLNIEAPKNYFMDKEKTKINMSWKETANILFSNWLNYYVYQITPYDLENL